MGEVASGERRRLRQEENGSEDPPLQQPVLGRWRLQASDWLVVFDADVGKLSEVVIKGGYGGVFGGGGCGDEAVDEMDFGLAIAF